MRRAWLAGLLLLASCAGPAATVEERPGSGGVKWVTIVGPDGRTDLHCMFFSDSSDHDAGDYDCAWEDYFKREGSWSGVGS